MTNLFTQWSDEVRNAKELRNKILISHIYLEHYLTELLKTKFQNPKHIPNYFSQKLKLIHGLGLIDEVAFHNLNQINQIRNHIAHDLVIDDKKIYSLLKNLKMPTDEKLYSGLKSIVWAAQNSELYGSIADFGGFENKNEPAEMSFMFLCMIYAMKLEEKSGSLFGVKFPDSLH